VCAASRDFKDIEESAVLTITAGSPNFSVGGNVSVALANEGPAHSALAQGVASQAIGHGRIEAVADDPGAERLAKHDNQTALRARTGINHDQMRTPSPRPETNESGADITRILDQV